MQTASLTKGKAFFRVFMEICDVKEIHVEEVPLHMGFDSKGTMVLALQCFLCGAGFITGIYPSNLYTHLIVDGMKSFQRTYQITDDGDCGPESRQKMDDYYKFDFNAVCESARSRGERSVYVQPNGERHLY